MKDVISINNKAEKLISDHIRKIKNENYPVSEISLKQYNYEFTVNRDKEKIKVLVYFGKKGISTVLQGNKESVLFNEINNLLFDKSLFEQSSFDIDEPKAYIGTDESGKGDYFGPLVVAGVYVNSHSLQVLKNLGVKDSKELSDNTIKKYAEEIRKTVKNNYEIISISPSRYNELYVKIGNVNRLLGWAHARVLENLLSKCEAAEAISDKFGDERLITDSLQTKGKKIILHQFTKAERYTGVAAASILARDKLNHWFENKNKEFDFELLKGASHSVEVIASKIVAVYGEEKLKELVKLHFKTTKRINRSNY